MCDYTPDAVKQQENSDTFKKKLIRFGQALGRRPQKILTNEHVSKWNDLNKRNNKRSINRLCRSDPTTMYITIQISLSLESCDKSIILPQQGFHDTTIFLFGPY